MVHATNAFKAVLLAAIMIIAGCAGGSGGGGSGAGGFSAGGGGGGMAAGGGGGSGGGGVGGDGGGMATGGGAVSAEAAKIGYSVGGAKDINNFRNNVEEGYLPIRTDVTYEGLFYDYYFDTGRQNRCTELFCPAYSRAITRDPLSNETEYYMTVGLNSGIDKSEFERKKLNLVIVLDISDSMSESFNRYYYDDAGEKRPTERRAKIRAAKESVLSLTDHLRDGDRFGMVTFNDNAETVVPMQSVGEHDMEDVRSRIRSLGPSGGTNLDAGMDRATRMVEPHADDDATEYETRIVYITDAMPNLGDTGTESLGGQLRSNANRGIYTTFVGVGIDFNTKLVESISDVRGANYYSVHSAAQFEDRMDEGFKYMVTPLVFDLQLSVESEGYEIETVYGSPEAEAATGQLMQVNTLFPSRTKNGSTKGGVILLKLDKIGSNSNLELSVSYENRIGEEFENTVDVAFEDRSPPYFENTGVRKAVLLSRYADLMKNWIAYERARLTDRSPGEPAAGIESPSRNDLGRWERESATLQVSSTYEERIETFERYYEREAAAIGDRSLEQEEQILERLVVANRPDDEADEDENGDEDRPPAPLAGAE